MAVPVVRKVYDGLIKHLIIMYLGGKLNPTAVKLAFLVMLLQVKSVVMKLLFNGESGDSRMASSALEQGAKLAKRTADAGAAANVEDVVELLDDDDEVVDAVNEMATDAMVWHSANGASAREYRELADDTAAPKRGKGVRLNEVQHELVEVKTRLASVAATTIQRYRRGDLARRGCKHWLARREFRGRRVTRVALVAATTIQQYWRGALARDRFKKLLRRRIILTRRMTPSSSRPWLTLQSHASPCSRSRRRLSSDGKGVTGMLSAPVSSAGFQTPDSSVPTKQQLQRSPSKGLQVDVETRPSEPAESEERPSPVSDEQQQSGCKSNEAEQGTSGQIRGGAHVDFIVRHAEQDNLAPISPIRLLRV